MKAVIKIIYGYRFVLTCFAILFATAVQSFGQVLPLDSVVLVINQNNPMLAEYDERINAQQAYVDGAKSWMAPMVGFGPYWVPYKKPEEGGSNGMYMAQIEQEIPNPGKLKAKRDYYVSRSAVETEGRAFKFNELKSQAKLLYYDALISTRQISALDKNKDVVEMMLKLARLRYPYNQGSLGSIYKTEARLHEIENMRYMAEGEVDQAVSQLKALMSWPQDRPLHIDTATQVVFNATETFDTLDFASRRSDVRQLDQTIEVMRLNQQLQQTNAKPDFKIRFEHMIPRTAGMPSMYSAMAMVSIPIAPWASKMYKSEVKGMQYEIQAMKKGRTAIINETAGMVASMRIKLIRMQQQIENYDRKILPALKKNYEVSMLNYQENREQLPVVVDSLEAYTMAQLEYLSKQREFYTMIVSYEKALEK